MKAITLAVGMLLLVAGATHAACTGPDGSSVPIGESKCFNGALMQCQKLTSSTDGLIFKERCPVVPAPKRPAQTTPRPPVVTQPAPKPPRYREPPPPYVAPTSDTVCIRFKDQFNAKAADYRRRCTPGKAIPIALANACNAEVAILKTEQAAIKRRCPQLPLLPAH